MLNEKILRATLASVKSGCAALILAIEGFEAAVTKEAEAVAAGPCQHPVARRRKIATMGDPDRFFCMQCNSIVGKEGKEEQV